MEELCTWFQVCDLRFASLLAPTAFSFGADSLAMYEDAGIGLQWDNMDDGDGCATDQGGNGDHSRGAVDQGGRHRGVGHAVLRSP